MRTSLHSEFYHLGHKPDYNALYKSILDITARISQNYLQLNQDKTEGLVMEQRPTERETDL